VTEFWEPWIPEPGQRVRYVFKHECPGVYGIRYPVGHPPEYDGLIGTMYEIYRYGLNEPGNGHRFLIRFDNERRIMAAALELVPV
jgi:hypothetical protein